ncbi:tetratricopeptide repeat protein [Winogradskyella sp.]|uniref:tetratricopeptide repeat protein n=1 Tax=Winogradskyella sp. TaxID=1883156 RepID=UPI0026255397|nr:hypothetical protein [uncultured Winogradskyella sp.]
MKSKYLTSILFLLIFQFATAFQDKSICSCELLKESKENDEKVSMLAREIEASFHDLSTDGFNKYFDTKSFKQKLINGIDYDANKSYVKGFLNGVGKAGDKLAEKIVYEVENGAYYNIVNYRYSIVQKAYYFTFRMYSEETGINYHDYKVCTDGKNIKVNDIYIYLSGEHLSETLNRIFIMSLEDEKNNTLNSKESTVSSMFKIISAQKLLQSGKYKEAYNMVNSITGPLKKEKFFLLIKALIASSYDDKIYENTLGEFAELYPDDPTLYLKLIDYYFLKENYKMVHIYIDKLMFETEDDFLNLMKANAYLLQKDYKNAEKSYHYIKINYPASFSAHVGEMICLTYQNRLEETLAIAQSLVDEGYDKKELTNFFEEKEADGSNELEAFVKSKIYKNWKVKP